MGEKKSFTNKLLESVSGFSYVDRIFERLKYEDNIYIFGAGDRAQWLGKIFRENGIAFKGYLVNKKYYDTDQKCDMYGGRESIQCFEDILEDETKLTLVLGISRNMLDMQMFHHGNIKDVIPINLGNRTDYLIATDTIRKHADEFDKLYDMLEDSFSKECLLYCIKGRITGEDNEFLPSPWRDPEYFQHDFLDWKERECLVDCGAFDGDTIAEFIEKKPHYVGDDYKIYAWEPDERNCKKLKERYRKNPKIVILQKAAFSRKGVIGFSSEGGEMSMVVDADISETAIDTIDNVLGNENATFIKMDIEGSELEALIGAKKQIVENKPKLAICIYHKQEDFWTIPKFIKSLNQTYKFYIRPHSSLPTELVLYCQ